MMTVDEIAGLVGGRVEGDGRAVIRSLAGLREARKGDLSFLANPKYGPDMARTRATAVLVSEEWQGTTSAARVRVAGPDKAFAQVAARFTRPPVTYRPGIHPTAVLASDATVGREVSVGPYCVVEGAAVLGDRVVLVAFCYVGQGVEIGEDSLLYSHVAVREHCRLGKRAILHNGAVVGSDGFGYTREGTAWKKIPQAGIVVLGDDVELGANTTVDRARFGETRIGRGVKIDNLVQVAHNVTIGEDSALAAQVGLAGSCRIGARVRMGGQAGAGGHLEIGDDAVVGGGAGVTKSVPAATYVSGYPAMKHDEAAKSHAHVMRLPELKKRVAELEARLKAIEGKP